MYRVKMTVKNAGGVVTRDFRTKTAAQKHKKRVMSEKHRKESPFSSTSITKLKSRLK